ncbi:MAG: serine/threonine protein phosphatase, partial [Verrucomicrobiota bacterium]
QMVCGHTPQETGIPRVAPGGICIDTYAYAKYGWLTCLDVEGETFYQANESGETRSGNLLDLAA